MPIDTGEHRTSSPIARPFGPRWTGTSARMRPLRVSEKPCRQAPLRCLDHQTDALSPLLIQWRLGGPSSVSLKRSVSAQPCVINLRCVRLEQSGLCDAAAGDAVLRSSLFGSRASQGRSAAFARIPTVRPAKCQAADRRLQSCSLFGKQLRARLHSDSFYSQFYVALILGSQRARWRAVRAAQAARWTLKRAIPILSIHSGVLKLGLQVVRDALNRSLAAIGLTDWFRRLWCCGTRSPSVAMSDQSCGRYQGNRYPAPTRIDPAKRSVSRHQLLDRQGRFDRFVAFGLSGGSTTQVRRDRRSDKARNDDARTVEDADRSDGQWCEFPGKLIFRERQHQ